jgi:hypothetical protein
VKGVLAQAGRVNEDMVSSTTGDVVNMIASTFVE